MVTHKPAPEVALRLIGEPDHVDGVLAAMAAGAPLDITGTAAPGARRPSRRPESASAVLQSGAIAVTDTVRRGTPARPAPAADRPVLLITCVVSPDRTASDGPLQLVTWRGPMPWPVIPYRGAWDCCMEGPRVPELEFRLRGPGGPVDVSAHPVRDISPEAARHLVAVHGFQAER